MIPPLYHYYVVQSGKVRGVPPYEFDKGLVLVGPDVGLGVEHPPKGAAQLLELLLIDLPRQVPNMQHLGWTAPQKGKRRKEYKGVIMIKTPSDRPSSYFASKDLLLIDLPRQVADVEHLRCTATGSVTQEE